MEKTKPKTADEKVNKEAMKIAKSIAAEHKVMAETGKKESAAKTPEEKSKATKYFFLGILGMIVVFLIFFYIGKTLYKPPSPPVVTYNKFVFENYEGTWYTQWQSGKNLYNLGLRFNPYEAEIVPIKGTQLNDTFNDNKDIYVTFDPNANKSELRYLTLAVAELGFSIQGPLQHNLVTACAKNETETCADRPIVDCNNNSLSVIYIVGHGETAVGVHNNCVILQGNELEVIRAADRFLYQWYGIINSVGNLTGK